MSKRHAPRDTFVTGLEERLRAELTRTRLAPAAPRWLPRSTRGLALATAALVVISMAVGGGAVTLAYQAQQSQLRNLLVGTYEQHVALARQRADLARQQLREAERRVAVGVESSSAVDEARLKVAEAEAEIQTLEIDLVEVRATSREPMRTVSAPLVGGRDLVSDRWRVELSAKAAALRTATLDAQTARNRFNVGIAGSDDVEAASARQIEIEAAIQLVEQKLAIRQSFLKGLIPAATAELRVLEAEADQRRTALARRIDLARRQMSDIKTRVEIGASNSLEAAEAEMRLLELQLAVKKAEYDLALIRKQLGK
jgi:outer membrane protein TolC